MVSPEGKHVPLGCWRDIVPLAERVYDYTHDRADEQEELERGDLYSCCCIPVLVHRPATHPSLTHHDEETTKCDIETALVSHLDAFPIHVSLCTHPLLYSACYTRYHRLSGRRT